jgi:LmbE family N-acetylglucosaminyl deacetylase
MGSLAANCRGSAVLSLNLNSRETGTLRLLCLGAHCDDIEIGCGGTILNLSAARGKLEVYWVVFSSNQQREQEALRCADAFLKDAASRKIVIHKFRDGFFPYDGAAIKESFEQIKSEYSPDLILTHHRHDLHQDHRLLSELTWNTFRNHLILEYEIPKYDGDFGAPNLFVSLDQTVCQRKIDYILGAFDSQKGKHWFSRELFSSVLRLRGMEAGAASGYAEGFYCRKSILAG